MKYPIWVAVCLFWVCASGCSTMRLITGPQPYDAKCDTRCYTPCNAPLDLPDGSANTLLAVSKVNRGLLVECSARRDACSSCLDALKAARVINP